MTAVQTRRQSQCAWFALGVPGCTELQCDCAAWQDHSAKDSGSWAWDRAGSTCSAGLVVGACRDWVIRGTDRPCADTLWWPETSGLAPFWVSWRDYYMRCSTLWHVSWSKQQAVRCRHGAVAAAASCLAWWPCVQLFCHGTMRGDCGGEGPHAWLPGRHQLVRCWPDVRGGQVGLLVAES